MARFKRGNTEIHIQNIRGRVNPALIVRKDGDAEVVAFFKGEYEAKLFAKVLAAMLKEGGKDGKAD